FFPSVNSHYPFPLRTGYDGLTSHLEGALSEEVFWMRYATHTMKLSDGERLLFYEVLAHNLTVAVRGIWSEPGVDDTEKVDRMKWLNEVLHRVTAKAYVLRLKTHEWTETDFEDMLLGYAQSHPSIAPGLGWAVQSSYRSV